MSILDREIKSSFKYRFIFAICAVMHSAFFLTFMLDGIYVLMIFNILSIIFYTMGTFLSSGKGFENNTVSWIVAAYGEITFHAALCTLWLGFESCFYLYAMIVLILASYILYVACEKEKFLKIIIPFAIVTMVSMVACYVYLLFHECMMFEFFSNELSFAQLAVMRGMNIFCSFFVIFICSIMFIAEMHVLINKLSDTNEQLNFIAMHDALTGLYNRHSIYEMINKHKRFSETESEIISDDTSSSAGNFCIAMGDIDDFKKVNDTYGHDCGDTVLKEVAGILTQHVQEDDLICRWGGEEFLTIMHGSKQECLDNVKSILLQINAARVHSGEHTVKVTMTFGLVHCDELEEEQKKKSLSDRIDALAKVADERLYQGKNSGKNKVVSE